MIMRCLFKIKMAAASGSCSRCKQTVLKQIVKQRSRFWIFEYPRLSREPKQNNKTIIFLAGILEIPLLFHTQTLVTNLLHINSG